MRARLGGRKHRVAAWIVFTLGGVMAFAQQPELGSAQQDSAALGARLDTLTRMTEDVQHQIAALQQRMDDLHGQVAEIRGLLAKGSTTSSSDELARAVEDLRERSDVQHEEIKVHEQTKLESVSKYPVKVSGLLLFSAGLNDGVVDDIDSPALARERTAGAPNGSLAATMRQSILGLEAVGPHIGSARTSADLHVDFFENISYPGYQSRGGTLRLRTAHVNFDLPHTFVSAAYDTPLISPLQPTSLVSQGVPPLAWSGNLWTWSPQLSVRHTYATGRGQAGWEVGLIDPASSGATASPNRTPGPGESSRQPGYEGRVSYASGAENGLQIGAGAYYGRQKYANAQTVNAWAATADWRLPLGRIFELSGEFYRGQAIAGLGGGTFKDYLYRASTYRVQALDAVGGWSQLKTQFTRSLEANVAAGTDQAFANELRYAVLKPSQGPYYDLARNRVVFANVIYRPRAYLAFSAEYRNFLSWYVDDTPNKAQGLALGAGYIF